MFNLSEGVAEGEEQLMAVVLHFHYVSDVVISRDIVVKIAHEGLELTIRHAELIGCREVEITEVQSDTGRDAVRRFPVGEVGG